ncbi:lysozyme inhibitor LprI family protein [Limnobacter sp.]|uniref:lysozyme inhibitor LprI family protein n=1 Tax=Limnobacter sp. TaxID=2003368 RepID=UPI002FE05355
MNKLMFKLCLIGLIGMPVLSSASSTTDEDFCALLKSAKAEMDDVFSKIQQKKRNDLVFLEAMNKSQKQWREYVDAELVMQFPSANLFDYGSVLPMCQCVSRLGLTQERIATLRQWLEPVVEGDVCTGSTR